MMEGYKLFTSWFLKENQQTISKQIFTLCRLSLQHPVGSALLDDLLSYHKIYSASDHCPGKNGTFTVGSLQERREG